METQNIKCKSFSKVKELINQDTKETSQCIKIMNALEKCCNELTSSNKTKWNFYVDFRDLKLDIHKDIELMDKKNYKYCEGIVNYYLNEIYGLCNIADVGL